MPTQYLEAAWAQIVDWRYGALTWEERVNRGEWIGPVKGPIGTAMLRVMYAIQQVRENAFPELRAAWITKLASYIMPDQAPNYRWREEALRRLALWYPRDPTETLGDVVPRQALDPDSGFNPEHAEALLNDFLASLNYEANPFLNSPAKMLELGFKGTPYRFNLEAERQRRALS
jgi:hypothetical protein